jgi:hypothetical protein
LAHAVNVDRSADDRRIAGARCMGQKIALAGIDCQSIYDALH